MVPLSLSLFSLGAVIWPLNLSLCLWMYLAVRNQWADCGAQGLLAETELLRAADYVDTGLLLLPWVAESLFVCVLSVFFPLSCGTL